MYVFMMIKSKRLKESISISLRVKHKNRLKLILSQENQSLALLMWIRLNIRKLLWLRSTTKLIFQLANSDGKMKKKSYDSFGLIIMIILLKRCIICRNEASNFCKDMRVPVCSKECKAKHMEEVSILSRFCNRPHDSVVN